jgi:hypothetical protein
VRDVHVDAGAQAALALEVAGDEVGRAGRDRRAQDDRVAGAHMRQQVVERGADVAHVDLDVGERGGAERQHDRVGAGAVGDAVGCAEASRLVDARDQLVGGGLLERHAAGGDGLQPLLVAVDPEDGQAAVGEAERERQSDAAKTDDRDVEAVRCGAHSSAEATGRDGRDAWRMPCERTAWARVAAGTKRAHAGGCSEWPNLPIRHTARDLAGKLLT